LRADVVRLSVVTHADQLVIQLAVNLALLALAQTTVDLIAQHVLPVKTGFNEVKYQKVGELKGWEEEVQATMLERTMSRDEAVMALTVSKMRTYTALPTVEEGGELRRTVNSSMRRQGSAARERVADCHEEARGFLRSQSFSEEEISTVERETDAAGGVFSKRQLEQDGVESLRKTRALSPQASREESEL